MSGQVPIYRLKGRRMLLGFVDASAIAGWPDRPAPYYLADLPRRDGTGIQVVQLFPLFAPGVGVTGLEFTADVLLDGLDGFIPASGRWLPRRRRDLAGA